MNQFQKYFDEKNAKKLLKHASCIKNKSGCVFILAKKVEIKNKEDSL